MQKPGSSLRGQRRSIWRQDSCVGIDYDQEANRYRAGREVPLEQLEPWRPVLSEFVRPGDQPLLDVGAGTGLWTRAFVTWFDADVIALEPSAGMREVGAEIGLPSQACYVAARAEKLPFGSGSFRAAWLSTVLHHLTDLSACARELRRALVYGAPVMIRNSFPGRLDEVELFRHFPAAAAVAAGWPALDQVVASFAQAGFSYDRVVTVRANPWRDLEGIRNWAVAMRNTDSALAPIPETEFAEGLRNLDAAIARGERPRPMGTDLVVFT
jgi:ubiquinone/menaquinone biosynthesis C-methylase UbiE